MNICVKLIFSFLFCALATSTAFARHCAQPPATMYLLRHADKIGEEGPLNERGKRMAKRLASVLKDEPVSSIFTSQKIRTQQTAAPLAELKRITLRVIETSRRNLLVEAICAEGQDKVIVIVGHADTIPDLLLNLHVKSKSIGYCDLFVITHREGLAQLESSRKYCDFGSV